MSRYIPVEPEKWGEMVAALALVPKLQAKIEELNQRWPNYHVDALIKAEAEVADLKAEVKEWQRAEAAVGEKVIEVCEENARLKAEVELLTDTLNKLVKTPPEATGGVRVKVDFWTQYGSRLPSSYETFWENAAKEGKPQS